MLNLLFNYNALWDVLIACMIFIIVIVCIKNPNSKWFVYTCLCVVFIGFTIFCSINISYYIKAHGGIYGSINGLVDPNSITTDSDNMTIYLENIMLTKIAGSDRYSATCTTSDHFSFDVDKNYNLFISGTPCQINSLGTNYLIADYEYQFLDNDQKVLLTDILHLRFNFTDNLSTLTIYTDGGSTAVKFWNCYFTRYKMELSLKSCEKSDYLIDQDFVQVNIQNYFIGRANTGYLVCYNYYIRTGQKFIDVHTPAEYPNYNFIGYSYPDAPTTIIDLSTITINSNTVFKCVYEPVKKVNITYVYEDNSTMIKSFTYGASCTESTLGMPNIICKSTEDIVYFWSWDNCGEIDESEYLSHSAFAKYSTMGPSIGGAPFILMEENLTVYQGFYKTSCTHGGSVPVGPGGGTIL